MIQVIHGETIYDKSNSRCQKLKVKFFAVRISPRKKKFVTAKIFTANSPRITVVYREKQLPRISHRELQVTQKIAKVVFHGVDQNFVRISRCRLITYLFFTVLTDILFVFHGADWYFACNSRCNFISRVVKPRKMQTPWKLQCEIQVNRFRI